MTASACSMQFVLPNRTTVPASRGAGLVQIAVSNNVGGVKYFGSTPRHALYGETRLVPFKNNVRRGVVGAVRAGFNQVKSGPVLVIMADLSDDLAKVDQMVDYYRQGYQVVAGSCYMPGGRLLDAPPLKGAMSRVASLEITVKASSPAIALWSYRQPGAVERRASRGSGFGPGCRNT